MATALQDWRGIHESLEARWHEHAGAIGEFALLAAVLFLVFRAIARRHRYRAVEVLSDEDRAIVEREVAEVEARTTGEIVLVVVERSDRHPAAHLWSALVLLAAGSLLLAGDLPWDRPSLVLVIQFAFAAVGFILSHLLADYQRTFTSEARATEMSEEQALQEFQRLELARTQGRTGVLIFVSLFERRVVVLADEGINARVDDNAWLAVDDAVLADVRRGQLREGLIAGARVAGDLLVEHFPADGSEGGELSNEVVVRPH
ncbi:MAG: hypothetical protein AAF726_11750 [Planctomycetota bacterium]